MDSGEVIVRALEPLWEAAVERVRTGGDPDCSESVIAWNEGYYKGISDVLAQLRGRLVISVP